MLYTVRFVFCLCLVFFTTLILAQRPSTSDIPTTNEIEKEIGNTDLNILQDSTQVQENTAPEKVRFKLIKSILDKKYPNPNRAAAMSLILPGSGQVYNKKIWKLPFVYGALGGLGYLIKSSTEDYKTFRSAYLAVVDDDPETINPFPTLSESSLLTLRDRFNKRRQQGIIFFSLAWILNSVDAFVDAHLASFDVSEDISMHVNPVGIQVADAQAYGVGIHFTYQDNKHQTPRFIY